MKVALIGIAVLLSVVSQSQQNNKVKLYAYAQDVTPGAQKARERDENGKPVGSTAPQTMANYFFYAVSATAARMYPVELWIKGTKYGVKPQPITQTPVTHTTNGLFGATRTTVLVPETKEKVLQLIPTEAVAGKDYPAAEGLAKANEVVLVFKQNGKFYYQTLSKFSPLEAGALQ